MTRQKIHWKDVSCIKAGVSLREERLKGIISDAPLRNAPTWFQITYLWPLPQGEGVSKGPGRRVSKACQPSRLRPPDWKERGEMGPRGPLWVLLHPGFLGFLKEQSRLEGARLSDQQEPGPRLGSSPSRVRVRRRGKRPRFHGRAPVLLMGFWGRYKHSRSASWNL
jgi:hypothetical protein